MEQRGPYNKVTDVRVFQPFYHPADIKQRNEKAVEEALAFLKKEQHRMLEARCFPPDSDSDASSVASWLNDGPRADDGGSALSDQENFVKALPLCHPLHFGFSVLFFPFPDKEYCYCPCSKKVGNWREEMEIPDYGCKTSAMSASGLYQHVVTIAGQCAKNRGDPPRNESKPDPHEALKVYMDTFYGDYWGRGVAHKALCGVNDSNYKRAERFEGDLIKKYVFTRASFYLVNLTVRQGKGSHAMQIGRTQGTASEERGDT